MKAKNNQNCQKIKVHGTLTTKEIKKHSSRLVGGSEMGIQVERMYGKVGDHTGQAEAGGSGRLTFT